MVFQHKFGIILMLLLLLNSQTIKAVESHKEISDRIEKTITCPNMPIMQIARENNILIITISSKPPDSLDNQRKEGLRLIEKYLSKDLIRASVVWQEDEFSYGKMASISNVYIIDFLSNKISRQKFINYFELEDINPVSIHQNKITKAELISIPSIFVRYSQILRQKADIYRFDKNYDSAIRIYNEVLEINPNDTLSFYWLGEIYKSQNHPDLAKEYYLKALSYDPDFKAANDALYDLEK